MYKVVSMESGIAINIMEKFVAVCTSQVFKRLISWLWLFVSPLQLISFTEHP
jgi:hypothetical protein